MLFSRPPARSSAGPEPRLGAVCCYFNPCGYESRRRNFRRFHDGLRGSGVRLVVVELAFGDAGFELGEIDADDVIRLRAPDIMWQKEALLNLGIRRLLDDGLERIAWLDADIAFRRDDWPARIAAALDRHEVVQVFRTAHVHQDPDGVRSEGVRSMLDRFRPSPTRVTSRDASTGYGWAARADLLARVPGPLYPRAIVGGADRLIYLATVAGHTAVDDRVGEAIRARAALAEFDLPAMSHDRLAWSSAWRDAMTGTFGSARCDIDVFFHGERRHRGHRDRFRILQDAAFDPRQDVRVTDAGPLAWSSDKPDLHRGVCDYFGSRREDRSPSAAPST